MAGILKSAGAVLLIAVFLFCVLDLTFPMAPAPSWSKVVYDRKGRLLNAYLSADDKWRISCQPEQTDSFFLRTLIQKEDRYFYYHPGINPIALCRAAFRNIISGERRSGASTITMQVIRLLEPRERSLRSKAIEIFRALQLESHASKHDILRLYLSLAPYGGNIEGITAASYIYFGKSPALLSPAEAVTLTIIPNRPSSLRPGRRNNLLYRERNRWLKRLYHEGLLALTDLKEALNEPLDMQRQPLPFTAPHLSRRLTAHEPGTEIYTTLDADLQEKVNQLCANHMLRLQNGGINNAAVLVIDNQKHEVLAYTGSQDYKDALRAGQVDGVKAIRSPGSTLKPLVYAMAIDRGLITPKSVLEDIPADYNGYSPENFDQQYHGPVSAEDALSASLNIPAVQLMEQISTPDFRKTLLRAGFRSIERQKDLGLSAVLGGCGVSLEELCGLYSSLANGGSYIYIRNTLKTSENSKGTPLFSPAAAYLITTILTKMNRPDLPFLFENSLHIPKIAWKTGTSYGRRDAWSIGYNQRYTIGVWIGNFDGKGVPELTGADMATPLLFQLFNSIDYNSDSKWFRPAEGLDLRYVCPRSGNIPGELCDEKVIDYFLPGISSTVPCGHLRAYAVDASEKFSYCTSCLPETGYQRKIYEQPSAGLLKYYRENGLPLRIAPPHHPYCTRVFEGFRPKILSLTEGQEYLIEKEDPRELELSCAVAADATTISWFIDDRFYKTVRAGEKIFFMPSAGNLKISCNDDKGRNSDLRIRVVYY